MLCLPLKIFLLACINMHNDGIRYDIFVHVWNVC